jgi:dTMP kinase
MKTQLRHPLIAVEGIDGSGKNTQAHLLVDWFKTQGFAATYRDFPRYENLTGKAIGAHLAGKWKASEDTGLDELVFQALMTVNRFEEIPEILQLLDKGPVVLDRYWASGYAYGAANGLPTEWLGTIHALLPAPDVCVLIDVPVGASWERRPERRDRYETQKDMLEKVRQHYHDLFKEKIAAGREWHILNGMGTIDEVQERLRAVFPTFLVR